MTHFFVDTFPVVNCALVYCFFQIVDSACVFYKITFIASFNSLMNLAKLVNFF